jgi:hypothetical protein
MSRIVRKIHHYLNYTGISKILLNIGREYFIKISSSAKESKSTIISKNKSGSTIISF